MSEIYNANFRCKPHGAHCCLECLSKRTIVPQIVVKRFDLTELDFALRIAQGRIAGKKHTGYFLAAGKSFLEIFYTGVLAEIAACYRFGGSVDTKFLGEKWDSSPDLCDADGYKLEVKAETWPHNDLWFKVIPSKVWDKQHNETHFVFVHLKPQKDPTVAEVYPAIHAEYLRKLGELRDWTNGPMWSIPAGKVLNQRS